MVVSLGVPIFRVFTVIGSGEKLSISRLSVFRITL